MKYIAHRGYTTKYFKENTMGSFYNARNHGFIGIELDTRRTKDGNLVVIHDASIDRVSDGTGFVINHTYNELLEYNFGTDSVPSAIPLLEDVLKKFKDMMLIVELKSDIDLESIMEYVTNDTYFISFDVSLIKRLKKKYPQFKFGILNYVLNSIKDYDLDAVCLLDNVATDNIVMSFLRQGIRVFIYGIVGEINYKRDYENLYYIVDKKY